MLGYKKRAADFHKLGKLPPRRDPRTLKFAKYLRKGSVLPPAPAAVDWTATISSWPMMANDTLGDCTCAAAGHMIECWTANVGDAFTPSNAQIVAAYSATSGYVVGDSATDTGAIELDVLNYWRQHGIAGHKIHAYAAFDPRDAECARQAIALFGGAYIGLALPLSAQQQDVWGAPSFFSRILSRFVRERHHSGSPSGDSSRFGRSTRPRLPSILRELAGCGPQSVSADQSRANRLSSIQHLASSFQYAPGSWGGHAVPVLAYDSSGLTCITWGAKKRMTWDFFAQYCDEAYAPLSPDWLNAQGKDPQGLDVNALEADLSELDSEINEVAPGTR